MPFIAPYFAAKAGEDALAVSYAAELALFGIDTAIVIPGAFTTGTNHYVTPGTPQTPQSWPSTTPSTENSWRSCRNANGRSPTLTRTRPKWPGR